VDSFSVLLLVLGRFDVLDFFFRGAFGSSVLMVFRVGVTLLV
jgi:hypothetical protein